jgi:tRNA G18 (ribose-2'-O)-methylase SpoU
MQLVEIDDPADPRVADFHNLTDADVRPDRRGLVIAEGVNTVARLAGSAFRTRAVIGVPSRIDALRPVLEPLDVPVFSVDKWVLSDVVGFRVTRGVLASADRGAARDSAELIAGSSRS